MTQGPTQQYTPVSVQHFYDIRKIRKGLLDILLSGPVVTLPLKTPVEVSQTFSKP